MLLLIILLHFLVCLLWFCNLSWYWSNTVVYLYIFFLQIFQFSDVVDKMVAGIRKLDFLKRSVLHTGTKKNTKIDENLFSRTTKFFLYLIFFEKNFGLEKKFGSGAASFFKLLKRFIFQNLIVSLGIFKKSFYKFKILFQRYTLSLCTHCKTKPPKKVLGIL